MILLAHMREAGSAADRRDHSRGQSGAILSIGGDSGGTPVIVLDLSRSGLRLHSAMPCPVDSHIRIEIPGQDPIGARVKWQNGLEFGCQFDAPLSKGAMSAFILRSPRFDGETVGAHEHTEIVLGQDAAEIGRWVSEFEAEGAGRRISGFRVDENQDVVAIITERR